jgi:hypothetical protein
MTARKHNRTNYARSCRRQSSFTCPPSNARVLKAAEQSERDIITRLVGKIARKTLRSRRWRG